MTKKHFKALAEIIIKNLEALDGRPEITKILLMDIALDIANYCQEQNPLFDRQRFLKACGL